MNRIIQTAEPFFFPAASRQTGCLLIHGFTGTPKEMRGMGEYLSRNGYPSLGVRLEGHATVPADMIRTRYPDWLASVEDGYALLRGSVERVIVIGLSMGGALSLLAASRLNTPGVIAISTPYALPQDLRLRYASLLSWFWPYADKTKLPAGSGWFDAEAWKDHVSYPKNPVRSLSELDRLLAEMRAALPNLRTPVLLIHSRDDTYVFPENMERIYAALGSEDKEKIYVTGSGHVATRDAARGQIFEAALNFVRRIEALA
jgi:carboxylesterase